MFQQRLATVTNHINTIRSIIKTNDKLRDIAFSKDNSQKKYLKEYIEFYNDIIQDIPPAKDWQVYDHCAAVTRLYAIYEGFVEDLVSDWLEILPDLFPRYLDLEENIRNNYQIGIGRLLVDLKKKRYEHLTLEEVLRGLLNGVTEIEKYNLLPDAFFLYDQNLRREVLEKLLADVGIKNSWTWIKNHRAVKIFIKEIRGNQNTVEGELNELIGYRNEAAHGFPIDNFLATDTLLELCDFVEALCQALAELVTHQIIKCKESIGQAKKIGQITEWFKKPKAGVAKVKEIDLEIGNSLFLVSEEKSYCQIAIIESIQINNQPVENVQVDTEREIGLKFDVDARTELHLYIIQ